MLKYLLSQTMERNGIQGVHVMMLQPAGVNSGLVGYAVVEKCMHKLWNGCHCGVGCRIVEGVCRYSRRKRIMPVLVQKYDFPWKLQFLLLHLSDGFKLYVKLQVANNQSRIFNNVNGKEIFSTKI
jgi:hypothetical protein